MAAETWTAQLHVEDGAASDDAPEIAYAERSDHRGRPAALYILAEPDRPGSEQFIGELVSRIGEGYLEGEGSLTGILQGVIRDRHEELLDWNRTSLPRDQASYGVSCLILRGGEVFLMQVGPTLAYYRHGERLLRRRPTSAEASSVLGGGEPATPEFSQLPLNEGDWVLLISSEAGAAISDEAIAALRGARAEDVLPALYPLLRPLPRVSALVVAVGTAGGAEAAGSRQPEAAAEPEAPAQRPAVAPAGPVAAAGADFADTEPERADFEVTDFDEVDYPPRRSLRAALGGIAGGLSGWLRGRKGDDAWRDETAWKPMGAAPSQETPPQSSPAGAAAGAAGDAGAGAEADLPAESPAYARAPGAEPTMPQAADAADDGGAASDEGIAEEFDEDGGDGDDRDFDDPKGGGGPPAAGAGEDESGAPASGPAPDAPLDRSVEYRLAPDEPGAAGTLQARAAGWPSNPFTPSAPPLLESARDADVPRFMRPLFALEGSMVSFRRGAFRRREGEEAQAAPARPGQGWGALALAVAGVLAVLGVVIGVLLVPDLLRDSEQDRFDGLLAEARRGLAGAALNDGPGAGQAELAAAQVSLEDALQLRPLDEAALALQDEVGAALGQINAIVRPPDLLEVSNLSGRVAPPLALSLIQVGAETLYMLDASGGRIFALPLAGGEPTVIFEAGARYPALFLFDGPLAAAPVSMQWADGAAGPALTILDAERRLYHYRPGKAVRALEMPQRELLGSAEAVAVNGDGIHILDVAGGVVWRYPQLSDATLLEPAPAIARTDLSGALSLAAGESLFVAGSDGRIRRFSEGVDQGFPLLDLDRELLVPASLALGELSGLLYAVDRGNNRVAIFTPAGELIAQLRDEGLTGVRGVVPDEANGRLYYVTADALLTSTLPPLLGS